MRGMGTPWENGFNPRPCVRGDDIGFEGCSSKVFQSTPLREGRL